MHKSGNLWLKDNLPSTDQFRNARISSFGYDANLVGSQSVATIRQIASSLNQSLIDMQVRKEHHGHLDELFELILS